MEQLLHNCARTTTGSATIRLWSDTIVPLLNWTLQRKCRGAWPSRPCGDGSTCSHPFPKESSKENFLSNKNIHLEMNGLFLKGFAEFRRLIFNRVTSTPTAQRPWSAVYWIPSCGEISSAEIGEICGLKNFAALRLRWATLLLKSFLGCEDRGVIRAWHGVGECAWLGLL